MFHDIVIYSYFSCDFTSANETLNGNSKASLPSYTCKKNEAGDAGVWSGDDESLDDYLKDGEKLKEPLCNAPDLNLSKEKYEDEGVIVQCVGSPVNEDGDNPVVPAENRCILLCDWYSVLSFYNDWMSDGSRGWKYFYNGQDSNEAQDLSNDNAEQIINCWG